MSKDSKTADKTMSIIRDPNVLDPRMRDCVDRIQSNIIDVHNMPIQLFETGRTSDRQRMLFSHGKAQSAISEHLFDLEAKPPIFATAMCYVYLDPETGGWSWNFRSNKVKAAYYFFGELVLDFCPELEWAGYWRTAVDYTFFRLRPDISGAPSIESHVSLYKD